MMVDFTDMKPRWYLCGDGTTLVVCPIWSGYGLSINITVFNDAGTLSVQEACQ